MNRLLVPLLLLSTLMAPPCRAEFGITPDGRLDMKNLRRSYMESDFVPVRTALESFMKKHKADATRDEKVFAHIYLGVIYAADSILDVKAESHFNALMEIAPNIELVDMFVPPKIQNMFDRVKHDYLRMKDYGRKYDALGNPLPGSDTVEQMRPKQPPKEDPKAAPKSGNNEWVWWTLGGVAAVGAGVSIYILATAPGGEEDNKIVKGP